MDSIYPEQNQTPKYSWKRISIFLAVSAFLILGLNYLGSSNHQISIKNPFVRGEYQPTSTPDPDYQMPENDSNRLDILILGVRGEEDPNAEVGGALLTDSIQIFSYDLTTKRSSLISLPRDLFVTVQGNKKDKLNTVYEYGLSHSPDSLRFVKDKFSQITGVYIDQVVIFDFYSFKDIVDSLGGIDITLAVPFKETQQWGYVFSLPAGPNHLDGQSALYYSRSRYSSNDFDRSRRQQEVIFAIKDKLFKLDFLSDPVKSFAIINKIRNNVETDISVWDIKGLMDVANQVEFKKMKHTVISTDNFLVESRDHGSYILLPKSGSLAELKTFFQNSLK